MSLKNIQNYIHVRSFNLNCNNSPVRLDGTLCDLLKIPDWKVLFEVYQMQTNLFCFRV